MQHIHKPKGNNSACVGLAFAMAAGLTWEEMVELIGHDGTKKFKGNPVGFHPQEIMFKLRTRPHNPVKFCEYHLVPVSSIAGDNHLLVDGLEGRLDWFEFWLAKTRGVLRLVVPDKFFVHAVAYEKGTIYDSSMENPRDYRDHPLINSPTEIYIMES